jgi:hypothetical protein
MGMSRPLPGRSGEPGTADTTGDGSLHWVDWARPLRSRPADRRFRALGARRVQQVLREVASAPPSGAEGYVQLPHTGGRIEQPPSGWD